MFEKLHMENLYSFTLVKFPAALSIRSSIVQFQLQTCAYMNEQHYDLLAFVISNPDQKEQH